MDGDESGLPRNIAGREAMLNAMTLDIALGGSTNTVLHLLAIANEGGVNFTLDDIDALSRKVPVLCKVAPNSHYHMEDVNRAGGILSIMKQLADKGLIDTSVKRADGLTLAEVIDKYAIGGDSYSEEADILWRSAPGLVHTTEAGSQTMMYRELDTDRENGCVRDCEHAYVKDGCLAVRQGKIDM